MVNTGKRSVSELTDAELDAVTGGARPSGTGEGVFTAREASDGRSEAGIDNGLEDVASERAPDFILPGVGTNTVRR